MNKSVKALVKELYSQEEMKMAKEIMKTKSATQANYEVLLVVVKNDVEVTDKLLSEFYEVDSKYLSEVDVVIYKLVHELSKALGEDVYEGFKEAAALSNEKPEVDYLVGKVREYLK